MSGTPAVAQQGVESGPTANTAVDSRRDEGTDWGWLRLIGLAGLAGLRRVASRLRYADVSFAEPCWIGEPLDMGDIG